MIRTYLCFLLVRFFTFTQDRFDNILRDPAADVSQKIPAFFFKSLCLHIGSRQKSWRVVPSRFSKSSSDKNSCGQRTENSLGDLCCTHSVITPGYTQTTACQAPPNHSQSTLKPKQPSFLTWQRHGKITKTQSMSLYLFFCVCACVCGHFLWCLCLGNYFASLWDYFVPLWLFLYTCSHFVSICG